MKIATHVAKFELAPEHQGNYVFDFDIADAPQRGLLHEPICCVGFEMLLEPPRIHGGMPKMFACLGFEVDPTTPRKMHRIVILMPDQEINEEHAPSARRLASRITPAGYGISVYEVPVPSAIAAP